VVDPEATIVPSPLKRLAAVLPFSTAAAGAAARAPQLRGEEVPWSGDDEGGHTLVPGFALPAAAVLPFAAAQGERVPLYDAPLVEIVPVPSPPKETPAPPALIGPIAVVAKEIEAARESEVVAVSAAAQPEVEIDFDVYPPPRCGAIAARLACAGSDDGTIGEILRGEDLDASRWQPVHAHWLERARAEAARSRKTLMSEYDGGYVGALEAERGVIALEEYARLAEAAERGEVAGALAEGGLPEGAWAHIHRVWIGRMVKDVRLGKQVRGAIEACRTTD
jgi:hypothetical protein